MPRSCPPATGAMLDAVDRARGGAWIERGLALAALADARELGSEPVGLLQRTVLELHRALGGGELEAAATCPVCRADAEFAVPVDALLELPDGAPTQGVVAVEGFSAAWRLPSVDDLKGVAAAADPAGDLRRRCLDARRDGRPVDVDELPARLVTEAEAAMSEGDPLAEVLVDVTCPHCGAGFVADLDPVGFVWADLEARAARALREVDEIARAYGWTEDEILALAPARRAAYLAIVRGEQP